MVDWIEAECPNWKGKGYEIWSLRDEGKREK